MRTTTQITQSKIAALSFQPLDKVISWADCDHFSKELEVQALHGFAMLWYIAMVSVENA